MERLAELCAICEEEFFLRPPGELEIIVKWSPISAAAQPQLYSSKPAYKSHGNCQKISLDAYTTGASSLVFCTNAFLTVCNSPQKHLDD